MKDKLLRKLLLEQNIIRETTDWDFLDHSKMIIDNASYTPEYLIKGLSKAFNQLEKDRDRLLNYLGLEIADIPTRPEMRVIRKKKK